jgi:hypothetical protein
MLQINATATIAAPPLKSHHNLRRSSIWLFAIVPANIPQRPVTAKVRLLNIQV